MPQRRMSMTHLAWPVRLTHWGMIAEQVVRGFWPFWTVLALVLAFVLMGWHDGLAQQTLSVLAGVAGFALLVTFGLGVRAFKWPARAEALARVDAQMPGRPIAALTDEQVIGSEDPASQAVWQTHLDRMAAKTHEARAAKPDLQIASRDPYGLRFVATLFFAVAFLFGTLWQTAVIPEVEGDTGIAIAASPVWEGWIQPPEYTGRPSLYLADIPAGDLDVSEGSRVTLRLYGDAGDMAVIESVSGRSVDPDTAPENQMQFDVLQSGRLEIAGADDASWSFNVLPDASPTVEIAGEVEADAQGVMSLPFIASDDYAVAAGSAQIDLRMDDVVRTHGLVAEADGFEPLIVDLPMPFSGSRSDIEELLIEDFSEHPFANLPVTITMSVTDALDQSGISEPYDMILPGRRFFQPVARAVIEQRRDLMWTTANAPRVLQIMRAISNRPEDVFTGETVYLRFREIQRNLQAGIEADDGVTPALRDELVVAMWELALQLEEGSLADARERLARAQERLEEAIRNGASDEEIAELMQEMREATADYLQQLADETDFANQTDQPDQGGQEGEQLSGDQIQEMMDEIQRLMEEGRMAEAMELMDELNALMENIQITQGEGGEGGPQTPGEQSMQDLQDNLREQQELSDDAFRELQEQFSENGDQPGQQPQGQQPGGQQGQQPDGQQPGGQPGGGQQPGQQPGQNGEPGGLSGQGQSPGDRPQGEGQDGGQGGDGEGEFPPGAQGTLAERQEALRRELDALRDNLPAMSGEDAAEARRAIEDAESAMEEAEEALRGGDLAEALDRQAEALEAMRDGMRALGRALAENEQDGDPGQSQADGGDAQGQPGGDNTDPLGRQRGATGDAGSDENMLQGGDVYRRAEELLEELRRRAAEQERPDAERDYLERLLDRF